MWECACVFLCLAESFYHQIRACLHLQQLHSSSQGQEFTGASVNSGSSSNSAGSWRSPEAFKPNPCELYREPSLSGPFFFFLIFLIYFFTHGRRLRQRFSPVYPRWGQAAAAVMPCWTAGESTAGASVLPSQLTLSGTLRKLGSVAVYES